MFPIGFPASAEFPGCISPHCVFIYPKSKFQSLPGPPVPQPPSPHLSSLSHLSPEISHCHLKSQALLHACCCPSIWV